MSLIQSHCVAGLASKKKNETKHAKYAYAKPIRSFPQKTIEFSSRRSLERTPDPEHKSTKEKLENDSMRMSLPALNSHTCTEVGSQHFFD